MSEGPKNVIPFRGHEELEKKAKIRKDFGMMERAFDVALLGTTTDEERTAIKEGRAAIEEVCEKVLTSPLQPKQVENIARIMRTVKLGLLKYLTDAQLEEIFGSDKL